MEEKLILRQEPIGLLLIMRQFMPDTICYPADDRIPWRASDIEVAIKTFGLWKGASDNPEQRGGYSTRTTIPFSKTTVLLTLR